jgi:hypothetical protein
MESEGEENRIRIHKKTEQTFMSLEQLDNM